jgi:hypothetical protein
MPTDFPVNQLYFDLNFLQQRKLEDLIELSDGGTKPRLISYSDRIMLSFLHSGHGKENPEIQKIRRQEIRHASPTEQHDLNEREITNCDRKSAVIADFDVIQLEKTYLSEMYYERKFSTGKTDEMIHQQMDGFVFQYIRNTKIPNFYRWMMDSGIYDRLQVEKVARLNNKIRNPTTNVTKKEKKMRLEGVSSLSGGLVTLFILCGVVIILALSSFVVECCHIISKLLTQFYFKISSAFKMCHRKKYKFERYRKIHVASFVMSRNE